MIRGLDEFCEVALYENQVHYSLKSSQLVSDGKKKLEPLVWFIKFSLDSGVSALLAVVIRQFPGLCVCACVRVSKTMTTRHTNSVLSHMAEKRRRDVTN